MADVTSKIEICPYCKKTFKRLKSHLPHCKMLGDANSRNVLSPKKEVSNSVASKFLNTEGREGQIKNTETVSMKENKKSTFDTVRNKGKANTHSLEAQQTAGSGRSTSLQASEDSQKQTKCGTEKPHKTEGSKQRASEHVQTQSAEKAFSKKSSIVQENRSKTISDKELLASSLTVEPLIQNGKSTSESPSQTIPKESQKKEAYAKQNLSDWPHSFTDDLQPVPQRLIDTVELVIENCRVRILRNGRDSSVLNIPLNNTVIDQQKTERWPVKASSGDPEIALADGQQIITESVHGKTTKELAGNVWRGETEKGGTTIKAHTSDDHFVDSCRKVSIVPVQLAVGIKSTLCKNSVCSEGEEYSEEPPVYTSPKSDTFPSFTEAFRESRDGGTSISCLTSLEKDTALCAGTVVTMGDKKLGISQRQPSDEKLEMSIAHWHTPPDRGIHPSSLGLEWFPELYPNYCGLGLFSRRHSQWDTRIPILQVLIRPCQGQQVPLAEKYLMDVKLQDMPAWLATRDLSLQGVFGATYRALNGYYNKYINMKKGRVAGISVLLLGCVLSYAWNYERIKHSRWRKYHE